MGSESVNTLRNASLEWRADAHRFTLEAEGWRSFQPIQRQEGGEPLIIVVRLNADAPIPESASIEELHFVKGEVVWSPSDPPEIRASEGSTTMEFVIRNGPGAWAPGDSVDVVAKVRDGAASSLVRAPRFEIIRVD